METSNHGEENIAADAFSRLCDREYTASAESYLGLKEIEVILDEECKRGHIGVEKTLQKLADKKVELV